MYSSPPQSVEGHEGAIGVWEQLVCVISPSSFSEAILFFQLQSLQSELHFRDAEMNELRMKLLNYERIKTVTPSVSSTRYKV